MDAYFDWNGRASDPFPGPFTRKVADFGSHRSPPSPLTAEKDLQEGGLLEFRNVLKELGLHERGI
jgi:hypothetical protein